MAHKGFDLNEYGTMFSKHQCDTCGTEFTVTPARKPGDTGWDNCMAPDCRSYDPGRDVDLNVFGIQPRPGEYVEPTPMTLGTAPTPQRGNA